MQSANWLTLLASLIALVSVMLSYRSNKKQLEQAASLTLRQMEAAAYETSRKLRAEILVKDRQAWIREFRDTINEILYLGDPELDGQGNQSRHERLRLITRLAHKVDLLLPVGQEHADLIGAITAFADHLKQTDSDMNRERWQRASEITILTRRILKSEMDNVESSV